MSSSMMPAKRSKRELFADEDGETVSVVVGNPDMVDAKKSKKDQSAEQGESEAARKEVTLEDMDQVMLMRYGEIRRKDKGVPIACDCGAAIHVTTSKDPSRRGQRYFTCFYEIRDGTGEGCGFRRGWEQALLDEFAKIKEEKGEMQKRLDVAEDRIGLLMVSEYELQRKCEELRGHRKNVDDYGGELLETQIGLAQSEDKRNALERRVEELEKKCNALNKTL